MTERANAQHFFIIEDALPLFNYFHIAFIYFLKDTTSTSQQVKKNRAARSLHSTRITWSLHLKGKKPRTEVVQATTLRQRERRRIPQETHHSRSCGEPLLKSTASSLREGTLGNRQSSVLYSEAVTLSFANIKRAELELRKPTPTTVGEELQPGNIPRGLTTWPYHVLSPCHVHMNQPSKEAMHPFKPTALMSRSPWNSEIGEARHVLWHEVLFVPKTWHNTLRE